MQSLSGGEVTPAHDPGGAPAAGRYNRRRDPKSKAGSAEIGGAQNGQPSNRHRKMVFTAETLCATEDTSYFVEEIFAYKPPPAIRSAAREAATAAGVYARGRTGGHGSGKGDSASGAGAGATGDEDERRHEDEEREEDEESHECTICMSAPSSIALLPCRHCCVCPDCFERLQACPICRAEFGSHVELPYIDEDSDEGEDEDGIGFSFGVIGSLAGLAASGVTSAGAPVASTPGDAEVAVGGSTVTSITSV